MEVAELSDESRLVIELQANGPIKVSGPMTITTADGRTLTVDRPRVSLCRCGGSRSKPFCDGAHKGIGFQADEAGIGSAG